MVYEYLVTSNADRNGRVMLTWILPKYGLSDWFRFVPDDTLSWCWICFLQMLLNQQLPESNGETGEKLVETCEIVVKIDGTSYFGENWWCKTQYLFHFFLLN